MALAASRVAVGIARLNDWWNALLLGLDYAHDTLHLVFDGSHIILYSSEMIGCLIVDSYLCSGDNAVCASGLGCGESCFIVLAEFTAVVGFEVIPFS